MDSYLPQLLSFPPQTSPSSAVSSADYDKQIKSFLQFLHQIPGSKLTSGVAGGSDLLDVLDPSINSLPYLYTLLAHVNGSNGKQASGAHSKGFSPNGPFWVKVLEFMEEFDPIQVRYAGAEFRRLIELVARTAQVGSKPSIAIVPIRSAILRLDPSSSCFTSSHLIFVHLCLEAREFHEALPVLKNDIYHFPLSPDKGAGGSSARFPCSHHESSSAFITVASNLSDKLEYQDHLKYFLYGAMIYIGLQNWERALLFLEIVIASPVVNTTSLIQVEAYKKWILVGLLLKGRPIPVPKTTSAQALKHYTALARAYETLAKTFKNGLFEEATVQRLMAESEAGQIIWQEDCNLGLVWQIIDAFRRFSILKLEKTYAALRIDQVAYRTSPDPTDFEETATYVTHLISAGYLNAILTESSDSAETWVLRFTGSTTTGTQARSELQQYKDLQRQISRTLKLGDYVRAADQRLALHKDYLDSARKVQKAKDTGGNGDMVVGDDFPLDEDMMADL